MTSAEISRKLNQEEKQHVDGKENQEKNKKKKQHKIMSVVSVAILSWKCRFWDGDSNCS